MRRFKSVVFVVGIILFAFSLVYAAESDYRYGIDVSSSTAVIWFDSNVKTTWVDVHYIMNKEVQLNYRMVEAGGVFKWTIEGVSKGDVIQHFFTYNNGMPAYDTSWHTYEVGGGQDEEEDDETDDDSDTSGDDGYTLVWQDEFEGTALNTSHWVYDIGTGSSGWGNNELEYYTDSTNNCNVQDGMLTITARKEFMEGMNYTSSRIKTQGKASWQYGKIEARIQLPAGQGLWPAFWMLGDSFSDIGWPACGEVDIMEHVNTSPDVHGTMHWDYGGYATYGGSTVCDVTQFHVYSIQWDMDSIKWFIDDVPYHEANIKDGINGTEEFHQNFFVILNLAVGGNWPGSPDSETGFPAEMKVDYIRVYQ